MSYLGDFVEDTIITEYITSHAKSGGAVAPSSALEAADLDWYKDGSAFAPVGITMTSPFVSTGLHKVAVDTSNDGGDAWTTGADYVAILTPDETVDGETVIRVVIHFSIENRFNEVDLTKIHGTALTETSGRLAGRFTDFFNQASAGFNIGTALSAFKATGFATATKLRAFFRLALRSDTGPTTDQSTELAEINANDGAGAGDYDRENSQESIKDDILSQVEDNFDDIGDVRTDISTLATSLLRYVMLIVRKDAAIKADASTYLDAINTNLGTGGGAYDNERESQEAIRDRGDAAWTTGAGGDATEAKQNTIITHLTDVKGATWAGGTDSLEAIRNRGDAAWVTGGTGSGATSFPYTVTVGGVGLADAFVWVTSDEAGTVTVASGLTNSSGIVTFNLDFGVTYWFNTVKDGYNFDNPDEEVID